MPTLVCPRRLFYDVAQSVTRRLIRFSEQLIRATKSGRRTFFDEADFPWVATIEREWRVIRAELDKVLDSGFEQIPNFQDISHEQTDLTRDDRWKTFMFVGYGERMAANCARCPQTMRALDVIPGLMTAMFSILAPYKHIPPHRGPYNGVLRYHLGLRVPRKPDRCRLRVLNEVRTWREGSSLIFDDSFEHEVSNDTSEVRAILFVDFVRPLSQPLAALNAYTLRAIRRSPFVQQAAKNLAEWEAARR